MGFWSKVFSSRHLIPIFNNKLFIGTRFNKYFRVVHSCKLTGKRHWHLLIWLHSSNKKCYYFIIHATWDSWPLLILFSNDCSSTFCVQDQLTGIFKSASTLRLAQEEIIFSCCVKVSCILLSNIQVITYRKYRAKENTRLL